MSISLLSAILSPTEKKVVPEMRARRKLKRKRPIMEKALLLSLDLSSMGLLYKVLDCWSSPE